MDDYKISVTITCLASACLETVPKIESILAFLPSQSPYAHTYLQRCRALRQGNKISQDSDTIAFKIRRWLERQWLKAWPVGNEALEYSGICLCMLEDRSTGLRLHHSRETAFAAVFVWRRVAFD